MYTLECLLSAKSKTVIVIKETLHLSVTCREFLVIIFVQSYAQECADFAELADKKIKRKIEKTGKNERAIASEIRGYLWNLFRLQS